MSWPNHPVALVVAACVFAGCRQGVAPSLVPNTPSSAALSPAATAAPTSAPTESGSTEPPAIDPIAARVQAAAGALAASRTGVSVYLRVGTEARTIVSGLASRNPAIEMTPDVRLQIASLSKAMTATIVMSLVEQGKVALDDPVDEFLPGLLAAGGSITVEQLLTHSSGLFNFVELDGWEWDDQDDTARELVALAEAHGPAFAPGEKAEYSNTGYVVLGIIIEKVTGKTLREALRTVIFEPAGMTGAGLGTRAIDGLVQARGYDDADVDVTTEHLDGAGAAGGVVATARDVGVFLDALFDGKLVKPATVADMATVHSMLFGSDSYGYGLDPATFSCQPLVGHTGALAGFLTNAWRTADGSRTVVVVVNDEPGFEEVLPILTAALCD